MSISTEVTVWCDGAPPAGYLPAAGSRCGQWHTGGTAVDTRREARAQGWRTNVRHHNSTPRDYCPRHAADPLARLEPMT